MKKKEGWCGLLGLVNTYRTLREKPKLFTHVFPRFSHSATLHNPTILTAQRSMLFNFVIDCKPSSSSKQPLICAIASTTYRALFYIAHPAFF